MFVQPEACIRLHPESTLKEGEHWYCDILAVSFREKAVTSARSPCPAS
jgi:hypothetical protein